MSLLNAFITPGAAFLAVDSLKYDSGGRVYGEASKCLVLPHLGVAIGSRGNAALLAGLAPLLNAGLVSDYDAVAADIGPMLVTATQFLAAGGFTEIGDAEIVVTGWSAAQNRAAGCYALLQAGEVPVVEPLPVGQYVSLPGFLDDFQPNWNLMDRRDEPAMFRNIAQVQQRMAAEHYPQHPIGGRLFMSKANRIGVTQSCIATLPALVSTAAAAA